ncbi:MAG: hypothetical protein RL382_320 [Actinomycetota bacterium]|jgi:uncharacterized protein
MLFSMSRKPEQQSRIRVELGSSLQKRQALPDQLRGFALLGIIVVNMPFLAVSNVGTWELQLSNLSDKVVAFLIVALAQGKFYLLFAFLFGYSLTLILKTRSTVSTNRYLRRLVGLAVLGAGHAYLFFIGDILMSYAFLGLVLLLFIGRSTRTVLFASAFSYVTGLALLALVFFETRGVESSAGGFITNPTALDDAIRGSFLDSVVGRANAIPDALLVQLVINWFPALSMFLLGLASGRVGLLSNPTKHIRLWRSCVIVGVFLGLPAGIASAWLALVPEDPHGVYGIAGVVVGFALAPALSAGYVGTIALLSHRRFMSYAEPAGRMSLTGYLGESILLAAIFCGWGFGLFGVLSLTQAFLVAIGVWAALEVFAKQWLHRFAYGPFEWIIRSWSNLEFVKLRKSEQFS